MANEIPLRSIGNGGQIDTQVNTTAGGSFTLSSPGLANLPVVDSSHHINLILDPDGLNGSPEEVDVTSHAAAATTALFTGGRRGSVGRIHPVDEYWVHGPTPGHDSDALGGGIGLIGLTYYAPGSDTDIGSTASSSLSDLDATNLKVDFVTPPSGKVLIVLNALGYTSAGDYLFWGLREAAANVADVNGNTKFAAGSATNGTRMQVEILVTGLVPGLSHTYKWAHASASGTGHTAGGPTHGPASMRVTAVNL